MKLEQKKIFIFISIIILIVILGFVVYANSLGGKFIWDDDYLIKKNVYIKDWSYLSRIFTEDWGTGAGTRYNYYRPLSSFAYLINYSIHRLDVKGYHVANVVLHISAALTLYWLITLFYDDRLLSALTSILFLVHPIHTEAVAYISGRPDSLAALFMFFCFIFYIKHLRVKNLAFCGLTLSGYILALLSKENSLILPVLILLYHYTFKKKMDRGIFMSLLAVTSVYIVLRLTVSKSAQLDLYSFNIIFQRMPGFFVAILHYIRLLVSPSNLHMEYGDKLFNISDPKVIFGLATSILLLVYAFKRKNEDKLIFFSVFWFFITLVPASNIFPIGTYMAEHYLYLPSIGFFLILAKGLRYLYKTKNFKFFAVGAFIGLVSLYSSLTIWQNRYWSDPITFYERTLRYAPHTPRVLNGLGNAYAARGMYAKAILAYNEAMEIDPNHADTYSNLGSVYTKQGNKEKGITLFEKAIWLNPGYADAYNNLGYLYTTIGRWKEAKALFERAIILNPNHADAYSNLGVVYGAMRENKKAIKLFKKAIKIEPNHCLAHNGLAVTYYSEGQYDLAIRHCDIAIKLGYKVHPETLELLKPYRK